MIPVKENRTVPRINSGKGVGVIEAPKTRSNPMLKLFARIFDIISNYYSTAAKTYKAFDTNHPNISRMYDVYMALCAIGAIVGAIYLRVTHPKIFEWLKPKNQIKRWKEVRRRKREFYTDSLQEALDAFDDRKIVKAYRDLMK
jgi:hypothetical protein